MDINEKKGWVLLSGGKDSTLTAFEMYQKDRLKGVIFIDTGIGLRETREYVEDLANKYDWKLLVFKGYVSYDDWVLKHGFPTPAGHSVMMHILKLDAIRRFISYSKKELGEVPLLFSGIRRLESNRRSKLAIKTQFYQGAVWDCPIFDYDTKTVWELHRKYNIPKNPAYDTIGKSGDCLCGAFGTLEEKIAIQKYYPYLAEHIDYLEKNTRSEKYRTWGNTNIPMCQLSKCPFSEICEIGKIPKV